MSEPLKKYRAKFERVDDLGWPYETEGDVYGAADVEQVLEEAKDIAVLLRAYIAMRTHPGCLENDPDYVRATRLLERLR